MKRHGVSIGRWSSTNNPWLQALSEKSMGLHKKRTITMRTELKESNISDIDANNQMEGYKLAAHLHQERFKTFDACQRPWEYGHGKSEALMKHIKNSRRKIHLVKDYVPGLTITCKTHNWSSCTTNLKDTTCRQCVFLYLKEVLDRPMINWLYNYIWGGQE